MSDKVTKADIAVLRIWSLSNRVLLFTEKSGILHHGKNNLICGDSLLPAVNKELHLGVTRTSDAACRLHLTQMARKATKLAKVILSSFGGRDPAVL